MTRVLYITGWCRSGTTLIGNLLAELDGVEHVGELRYLWTNGVLGTGTNRLCGCGDKIEDCGLWSAVLTRVAGDDPDKRREYAEQAVHRQDLSLRTRHTRARLSTARQPEAVGDMVRLYEAIAAESGASVIVDSGKFPAEAAALCRVPGVDVRVLHVVRDPRATAESWRTVKEYIPAMAPGRSTGYWVAFNLASELIGRAFPERYLRVRYEDFTRDPRAALQRIMRLADLTGEPPVDTEGNAVLHVNHTVTGNPDRLRRGPLRVRRDDRWLSTQPPRDRALATAVALPLLPAYRYPLVPRRKGV